MDALAQAARRKNGLDLQVRVGAVLVLIACCVAAWALTWPLFSAANLGLLGLGALVNAIGAPLLCDGLERREQLLSEVRLAGWSDLELDQAARALLPLHFRLPRRSVS